VVACTGPCRASKCCNRWLPKAFQTITKLLYFNLAIFDNDKQFTDKRQISDKGQFSDKRQNSVKKQMGDKFQMYSKFFSSQDLGDSTTTSRFRTNHLQMQ
jgi:hypothetical protein